MAYINFVAEGDSDAVVISRVIAVAGLEEGRRFVAGGKSRLDRNLQGYNAAARHGIPWLVVRDLDREECAPALVAALLPRRDQRLLLRVAVRSIEAWLLADVRGISNFLGVRGEQVPSTPDLLPDPKVAFVNLARLSRYRAIRADIVPVPSRSARVGPNYTGRIIEFAIDRWDPTSAATNSPSLESCIRSLRSL